jgi:2-polyprenyl-3-methyl-5-hydroxy-6-metoxy-1,4-benzoquinol methylase
MDINHSYTNGDHAAREYDAYALSKYRITLRWLDNLLTTPTPHILNVGAGSGVFSSLADRPDWTVTNVEPDASAVTLAEGRLGKGSVIHADLLTYAPTRPADVIVMHDVLEHIANDSVAVARIHALLGGGTRPAWFIASVPAWQWLFGYHD